LSGHDIKVRVGWGEDFERSTEQTEGRDSASFGLEAVTDKGLLEKRNP
jgi:hypothetical protein